MSTLNQFHKRMQIAARRDGEVVIIHFTDYPAGAPDVDPTTGSVVEVSGTSKTCTTKALTHRVAPSKSTFRAFAEIQEGDMLIDFCFKLYRVSAAGNSGLTVGSVIDQFDLGIANRAASRPATFAEVSLGSLGNLSFEVDGERWAPVAIGGDIAKTLDCVFRGKKFIQTIYARRQK